MKQKTKILIIKLIVAFVVGYFFNGLISKDNETSQPQYQEIETWVAEQVDLVESVDVDTISVERQGEFVVETKNSTVNDDDDIVVKQYTNHKVSVNKGKLAILKDDIIGVKPRYTMSFYLKMLDTVKFIRAPDVNKAAQHMALVIQKRLGYSKATISELIAEIAHNPLIMERVTILAARGSSP